MTIDRARLQYLATLAEGMSVDELNMLVLMKGLNILANTVVDTANEGDYTMALELTYDSDGIAAPSIEAAGNMMDDMVHREEMWRVAGEARHVCGVNVGGFFTIERRPTAGFSYRTLRP